MVHSSGKTTHHTYKYTPKAVVIDNHLPRQPLISSYVPDWPLPRRVYIPSESEMALRARIYAYNRHLSFDVAFICSTLTHCGVCHLSVWRLKWEVSYVHQSVWRWKWFFCQSNYVLQRLRLCRTSDTVFRREIDSRRQWGYGTCYGGIVSPLRRSVTYKLLLVQCQVNYVGKSFTISTHSPKLPIICTARWPPNNSKHSETPRLCIQCSLKWSNT